MNTYQKILGLGALLGTVILAGCKPAKVYLEGTVIKEAGTVAQITESSGALFGNESVRFSDPTYILKIQTSEGVYTASVYENYNKPLEALALAIEEGDKVRFAKRKDCIDNFGEDRIGKIYSDQITLLDKK